MNDEKKTVIRKFLLTCICRGIVNYDAKETFLSTDETYILSQEVSL